MNWIDYVLLLIVLYFAFRGFCNGFLLQFFSLAGLVLAWFAAFHWHVLLLPWLSEIQLEAGWAKALSMILTFLLVLGVAVLIGKLLTQLLEVTPLGVLNRLAGIVLGLLEGVIVLVALFLLWEWLQSVHSGLQGKSLEQSLIYQSLRGFFHFK